MTGNVNLGNGLSHITKVSGKLGIQDTAPPQKFHIDEIAGMEM